MQFSSEISLFGRENEGNTALEAWNGICKACWRDEFGDIAEKGWAHGRPARPRPRVQADPGMAF
jgi:hypothetical protein